FVRPHSPSFLTLRSSDLFLYLKQLNSIENFITENKLALLYISRPNCSVCHGLKPQVQELMTKYPDIQLAHIDADEVQEVAGRFRSEEHTSELQSRFDLVC